MFPNQIAFFEANRYQNVRGRDHSEEQVRYGHIRRAPEDKQPADVQRVTNHPIQDRCRKAKLRRLSALQLCPDLPKPEQVKVIDGECRYEHQKPSERERRIKNSAKGRVIHLPYDAAERLPLPKQESERQTAC